MVTHIPTDAPCIGSELLRICHRGRRSWTFPSRILSLRCHWLASCYRTESARFFDILLIYFAQSCLEHRPHHRLAVVEVAPPVAEVPHLARNVFQNTLLLYFRKTFKFPTDLGVRLHRTVNVTLLQVALECLSKGVLFFSIQSSSWNTYWGGMWIGYGIFLINNNNLLIFWSSTEHS